MRTKITLARPVHFKTVTILGTDLTFQEDAEVDLYHLSDGTLLARQDGDIIQWAAEITRDDIKEETHIIDGTAHRIQTEALNPDELLMSYTERVDGTYTAKTLRGACHGYPGQVDHHRHIAASEISGKLIVNLDGGNYTGRYNPAADYEDA